MQPFSKFSKFTAFLRTKLWALAVMAVGSWIPRAVNLVATDTFKRAVKAIAERNDVSSGMYQLLGLAASNPVSACVIVCLLVFCGAAIFSAVQANGGGPSKYPQQPAPDVKVAEEVPIPSPLRVIEQNAKDSILKNAPSLLVDYVAKDERRYFVFRTERGLAAIFRKISPLVSRESYEGFYELDFTPGTPPPITSGRPVECLEISPVSLKGILQGVTPSTLDSFVVDYDDTHCNKFSRQFIATLNMDGTIALTPGPICLRDGTQAVQPDVQDIIKLREKLHLARLYRETQQYAEDLREETD